MFYPKLVVIANTTASAAIPSASAYIDHEGPGLLFWGFEQIASALSGSAVLILNWTDAYGLARSLSATGCSLSAAGSTAASGSATGLFPYYALTGMPLSWQVSNQVAPVGAQQYRFWLTYLGGERVGTKGAGLIAG